MSKYYNYPYGDMRELSLYNSDNFQELRFTSTIYPTKLEVEIDEKINRPYLYYEGIVNTNRGLHKIIFPKLEMALDCIATKVITSDINLLESLKYKHFSKIIGYKLTTEFHNISRDDVVYEIRKFSEEDYEEFSKLNGIKR